MKALQVFRDQGAHVLTLPAPEPNTDEVLIKTRYSAINYKDALAVTGKGKILKDFPMIPGIDVAGTIKSSNHENFKQGEEVLVTGCGMGERYDGGFAELVKVPVQSVIKKPVSLTLEECITLGTAGFTAAYALYRLEENHLTPEQGDVIVTGATGGVGSIAVNILAKKGYRVVAMSGKATEKSWLEELGAAEIIPRYEVEDKPRPLESALWAGAVDNAGGKTLAWLTRTMKPGGSIASIGLAAGHQLETTVMPFILRGINLLGINSADCPMPLRQTLWNKLASDYKPDKLDSILKKRLTLEEVENYTKAMLSGKTTGRAIIEF